MTAHEGEGRAVTALTEREASTCAIALSPTQEEVARWVATDNDEEES